MTADGDPVITCHCNSCRQVTQHACVAKRVQSSSEPYDRDTVVSWSKTFELLECRGCGSVTTRLTVRCSEWDDDEIRFFPPRVSRHLPIWHTDLREAIRSLLEEVYVVLHEDCRRLALMGARAVLDRFVVDKVGDLGTFAKGLAALEDKRTISSQNRRVLEAALDLSHAVTHRGHLPSSEQVNQVIDIIENLLQSDLLDAAARHGRWPRCRSCPSGRRSLGPSGFVMKSVSL